MTETNHSKIATKAAAVVGQNTVNQKVINLNNTTGVIIGDLVTGHRNIPDGSWVASITGTTVTLNQALVHPQKTVSVAASINATTLTLADVDDLTNGMTITGTGIPANTFVSVNSDTKVVTLKDSSNTATANNVQITADIGKDVTVRIGGTMATGTNLFLRNSDGSLVDNGTTNHTGMVTHMKVKKGAGGATSGAYTLEYSEIRSELSLPF